MTEKINNKECFYCGDDTQKIHRDHVKPSSMQESARSYNPKDTVSCCVECNNLLGDWPACTVEGRAEVLIDKLTKKYSNSLKMPDWTDAELRQQGPHLKSKIKSHTTIKEWVKPRLKKLSEVSFAQYDQRKIEHLRGMTTKSKVMVYHMISDYLRADKSQKQFIEYWSSYLDIPKKDVEAVINESIHYDIAVTIKIERKWPVGVSLKKLRRIIQKGS